VFCVYIVGTLTDYAQLGEFEVVVLMAVLHTQDRANGSAVRDQIEQRSGRDVSRGAVYITLERLHEKGLLTSTTGGGTAARGNKPTRLFRVTPLGVKSLKHSLGVLARMHRGLEPVLGEL